MARAAAKQDLQAWVIEAPRANDGSASVVDVARHLWIHHESDLRASGDLFYTWQYDLRWAAHLLRLRGVLKAVSESPHGVSELVQNTR